MISTNACSVPRRGITLVYAIGAFVAIVGFMSFAVDFGRVQMARSEIQSATDAAARYGATALSQGVAVVQTRVATAGADNKVDGVSLTINPATDVEFGTWDPVNRVFTVLSGTDRISATAIRVTGRRAASRNTPIPLFWGGVFGRRSVDIKAVSVATRGRIIRATIEADSCPWLAGMPNGAICDKYDENPTNSVAPAQSPLLVTGVSLKAGTRLSFRQMYGTTGWDDGSGGTFGPDGDTSWIVQQQPENNINYTKAPIQCLVGIFLDARTPTTYAQGTALDFTTEASRDASSYTPALKQVFFIGNGINSAGQLQEFIVPSGATRFYLGLMDEKGWWWDNYGTVTTSVIDDDVQTVK